MSSKDTSDTNMRLPHLLIVTQKADKDDDVLGFFHAWIREFAKHCERVTVVCLQKGACNLPENVRILSLGKGEKKKNVSRATYLFRFYRFILREKKNYDAVFVHMNKEYILLGAPVWKLFDKKIGLWYAHGHTDFLLRMAEQLSDIIFTSTKSGFRLPSKKISIVGQGIDTELFKPSEMKKNRGVFEAVTVGRISPVKDYETLLRAVDILSKKHIPFHVTVVGGTNSNEEKKYLESLRTMVAKMQLEISITFVGSVPNAHILKYLQNSDLFVNMSHTGSLDKAILEAMSSGLPIVTSNEALLEVLGEHTETCLFPKKNAASLAEKMECFMRMNPAERKTFGETMREIVVKNHNLDAFVQKILEKIIPVDKNSVSDTMEIMKTQTVEKFYNVEMPKKFGADYEYNRWFKTPVQKAMYEMTKSTIERVMFRDGKQYARVLELGQGAGTWSKLILENKFAGHLDMTDISSHMLSLAKNALEEYPNTRFIEKDFLDFSADKAQMGTQTKGYDFFFSSRVIEYLPDKEKAVSKIFEILPPNGSGFIITKTPKYFINALLGRKVSALHGGQISPRELRRLFEARGFSDIRLIPVTMSFPIFKSAILNTILYKIFGRIPLNPVSQFFSESYGIRFTKKTNSKTTSP